jgi:predicted PurR-regulated permease PerM
MTIKKMKRKAAYPTYQLFFIATLFLFGYIIWNTLGYLLVPFLWSIILYVIFQKFYNKLIEEKKWKPELATLLVFFLSFIPIILLSSLFFIFVYPQIENAINNYASIRDNLLLVGQKIEARINLHIFTKENMLKASSVLSKFITPLLSSASSILSIFSFSYFFAYFIFVYNRNIKAWMLKTLPFGKEKNLNMLTEINTLVYGGVVSIPLVAMIQGVLAIIGYAIFRIDYFIVFGLLTGLASIIPMIGSMVIYLPLAIYYFLIGEINTGIAIVAWGALVISSADNVIRIFLSKRLSNMSALVSMLGFLLGASLFGISGLIFGPVILTLFIKLIQIYQDEFTSIKRDKKEIVEAQKTIDITQEIDKDLESKIENK